MPEPTPLEQLKAMLNGAGCCPHCGRMVTYRFHGTEEIIAWAEGLELSNHKLEGECGHLEATVKELKQQLADARHAIEVLLKRHTTINLSASAVDEWIEAAVALRDKP